VRSALMVVRVTASDRRRKKPRAGLINEINMMLGWI
jgi:hypothetical protein